MSGVLSGKAKPYRILLLPVFAFAVLSFLRLPKLAYVWKTSSDANDLRHLSLIITLVRNDICLLWGQDQEFTVLQDPCWFLKETHAQALPETCWVIIHRVGTRHLYWPGINPWAGVEQPLETIHLDHEFEHEVTHCLVISSHFNVFKYRKHRTLSLCTLT